MMLPPMSDSNQTLAPADQQENGYLQSAITASSPSQDRLRVVRQQQEQQQASVPSDDHLHSPSSSSSHGASSVQAPLTSTASRSARPRPPMGFHTTPRGLSDGSSSSTSNSSTVPPRPAGTVHTAIDTGASSTLHSSSGSLSSPRKPWSRAISTPYGIAKSTKPADTTFGATSATLAMNSSGVKSPKAADTYVVYYDDHDPGRWHTDAKEADDFLHDPEKPIHEQGLSSRGFLNLGTLVILTLAIFMLFMGYPVLSEFYFRREGTHGGYNLGGSNASGQLPSFPATSMRSGLIDSATPQAAYTKAGLGPTSADTWNLQFSDEFEVAGRSFYPGDDPVWEAVNLYAHGTGDYEWYDPAAVTTKNGALTITVIQDVLHNLNFRSGQLTTWNKFCYTGGYLEAAVILPGSPRISGWWPAIWTMGNLGRANYGATTEGTWPYSYNSCDLGTLINQTEADGLGPPAAIKSGGETTFNRKYKTTDISWQPGQKLSACTCPGDDHPGPTDSNGNFVGRSAPEIDMFEAQIDGNLGGTLSLSGQFMPASSGYYLANATGTEYPTYVVNGDQVKINTYRGNILQQSASGIAATNQRSYELSDNEYSIWGFEYEPGNDGYITWWIDGVKAWTLTAAAVGADALTGISQRPIPEEPMYILMNVALSSGFGNINWDELTFPATMKVDYMRLYQAPGSENIGCDPPNMPTSDYINRHMEAYTNANLTNWGGDASTGGYGQNWPRNRLYNNGDGCSEAPRNYPGRLRPNGITQAPWQTVPTAYTGNTALADDDE